MTEMDLNKHQLFLRCEKNSVSYKQICLIVNGQSNPSVNTLRIISKALHVPFSDLLIEAGYIKDQDVQDIHQALRDILKPIFDDGIVDLLTDKIMIQALEIMLKLDKKKQKECLNHFLTYITGYVAQNEK
tara:strand:- start:3623 stop:4012 length:390 start_codon:yes stop_codon:yes gene_type:complete